MARENFGQSQAKLHLAKKTLANLTQASIAFSDITSNWRRKLWRIRNKSPKFFPAKIFRCTVQPEMVELAKQATSHFQELHRVLVPGGNAILLIPTDWSHSRLYTTIESDPSTVRSKKAQILKTVPKL